jgi:hypothetical protein
MKLYSFKFPSQLLSLLRRLSFRISYLTPNTNNQVVHLSFHDLNLSNAYCIVRLAYCVRRKGKKGIQGPSSAVPSMVHRTRWKCASCVNRVTILSRHCASCNEMQTLRLWRVTWQNWKIDALSLTTAIILKPAILEENLWLRILLSSEQ